MSVHTSIQGTCQVKVDKMNIHENALYATQLQVRIYIFVYAQLKYPRIVMSLIKLQF